MTSVPGDPASLSACASTVRAVAGRLSAAAAALGPCVEELGEGWPGRASARTRRRAEALGRAGVATASELDRLAVVLQDHATDLADLVARARAVEERAVSAGLEVRGGRVLPAFGVLGEADAEDARRRAAVAEALQSELDLVGAQHARRRDWVLGVLRSSTTTLDEVAHEAHRG